MIIHVLSMSQRKHSVYLEKDCTPHRLPPSSQHAVIPPLSIHTLLFVTIPPVAPGILATDVMGGLVYLIQTNFHINLKFMSAVTTMAYHMIFLLIMAKINFSTGESLTKSFPFEGFVGYYATYDQVDTSHHHP